MRMAAEMMRVLVFFFSSRRRHTRCSRDWSSDVCSSDLLIFEDLHWIDNETQAAIDRLIEGLPTARIMLLVTYRPEYQPSWGSKTYSRQVRLDPLEPDRTEELLTTLVGDGADLVALKRLLF